MSCQLHHHLLNAVSIDFRHCRVLSYGYSHYPFTFVCGCRLLLEVFVHDCEVFICSLVFCSETRLRFQNEYAGCCISDFIIIYCLMMWTVELRCLFNICVCVCRWTVQRVMPAWSLHVLQRYRCHKEGFRHHQTQIIHILYCMVANCFDLIWSSFSS
jgi:hypothetical protein